MRQFALIFFLLMGVTVGVANAEGENFSGPKLQVPKKYSDQAKEDRKISNQIGVRFSEHEVSVLQLEYEGEKHQTPVIAATFVEEKCESVVSAESWKERYNKDVSLCYRVQSLPRNFGAYQVKIEHHHVTEASETVLKTYSFPNPETFEDQRISIGNCIPGTNRFVIRVETAKQDGTKVLSDGLSHIVLIQEEVVQAPTMSGTVDCSSKTIAGVTFGSLSASAKGQFRVSKGISASMVTVAIRRRGSRQFGKAAIRGEGSPFLGVEGAKLGWSEIFRGKLEDAQPFGVAIEADESGHWKLSFAYRASVSSTHLPFKDQQEYQIDVSHPNYPKLLASFRCRVDSHINMTGKGELKLSWPAQQVELTSEINIKGR